ncbi:MULTISPECIES: cytochrome c3 family protein [Myxococcus]|uniref:Cytochrome c3 family protein n=2 Tax=Myxococcus TaxID=32 RepID=A0ABX7NA94_9BACT|nr:MULTISPECIES: cytochrome c3 family protein [Myxococcus]AGC47969.1 putative cytochrome c [Myxococcus stipitatus DSM 14675]QSQ13238.1 cytochrome c3 family protein [Myxococcus landrumus]
MSGPLFPRWTNTVSRLSAAALLAVPAIGIGGLMAYVRSPYVTGQQMPIEQPIEFDHRHHAGDEKIDCQYCHFSVDKSPSAGIPSTTVCMSCHAQVWNKSPYLTEVRKAFFADAPIQWVRVHNLPDFVYFNHSIHVNKGVGCASCHGRVDQMAAVEQFAPLTMAWCLECHRNPEPHLRPSEFITSMTWTPPADKTEAIALGEKLKAEYDVHSRTSCSTCHR